tara:strand:+ start:407 stop:754 length:348 start_codon:yes stop_codon:yes gene_type:complete
MENNSKNLLFQIDEQQLRSYIILAVKSAMDEVKEELNNNRHERPLQAKELAKFLSCSPESITNKAKARLLPHYRFKGKRSPYYFFVSQVLEVLREGKVHTWHELGIEGYEYVDLK